MILYSKVFFYISFFEGFLNLEQEIYQLPRITLDQKGNILRFPEVSFK